MMQRGQIVTGCCICADDPGAGRWRIWFGRVEATGDIAVCWPMLMIVAGGHAPWRSITFVMRDGFWTA